MSLLKKVMVNTGSNLALMLVKAATIFVITPITLNALGRYDYGIWEMITAAVGYMGILQVGLMPAVSRYTARLNAQGADDELRAMYSTSMLMLGLVGAFATLVFSTWALWRPDLITPDGGDSRRYAVLLLLVALRLLIVFPGHVAESVLEGLQLYSTKNKITVFTSVGTAVMVYFFIHRFDPLIFLALIGAAGAIIRYLIFFRLVHRATGGRLRVTIRYRSRALFKELIGFGGKSFVQGASTSLEGYAPTLIIGMILGPAQVVYYALPLALIRQVRNFTWTMTHAFMPLFSELHARDRSEAARKVFMLASRVVVGLVFPIALLIILLGPDFLGRWAGHANVQGAAGIVGLLAIANLLGFLNPFASRYLTAIGQHGILAKIGPFSAGANVLLGLLLVGVLGIYGPPVAGVCVACVVMPTILYFTCKHLQISVRQYATGVLLRFVLPGIFLSATVLALESAFPATTYLRLALIAAAGGGVYLLATPFVAMTGSERRELLALVRSGRRRRKQPPVQPSEDAVA